jgi:DNA-binding NarL/FixJ family response regulator
MTAQAFSINARSTDIIPTLAVVTRDESVSSTAVHGAVHRGWLLKSHTSFPALTKALRTAIPGWLRCHSSATGADTRCTILADLEAGPKDAIRFIDKHSWLLPMIAIVACVPPDAEHLAGVLMTRGTLGLLMKPVTAACLDSALIRASNGQATVCDRGAEAIASFLHRLGRTAQGCALTPRERDVLPLLVQGVSEGEIAMKLRISTNTAHAHKWSIYRKMGCTSAQAVAVAVLKNGLKF